MLCQASANKNSEAVLTAPDYPRMGGCRAGSQPSELCLVILDMPCGPAGSSWDCLALILESEGVVVEGIFLDLGLHQTQFSWLHELESTLWLLIRLIIV